MNPRTANVSSPGKLTLTGEHSVVYGHPALIASIDRRLFLSLNPHNFKRKPHRFPQPINPARARQISQLVTATLPHFPQNIRVSIDSQIPIGAGLGSSAAMAVAFSAAVYHCANEPRNLSKINALAYQIEKLHHGNPSGVDNTISTYGGFLWYRKETENFRLFQKIKPQIKFPPILLLNSGKPQESTKQMVQLVSNQRRKHPRRYHRIMLNLESLARSYLDYLSGESLNLLKLVRENHRLLIDLGVVSGSTAQLVHQIERLGGAAKISGAGGRKQASGVLIVIHPNPAKLFALANRLKLELFTVKLGGQGVKIEK